MIKSIENNDDKYKVYGSHYLSIILKIDIVAYINNAIVDNL